MFSFTTKGLAMDTKDKLLKAPDFTLLDENNTEHQLKNYLGQYVLVYFYPKDDTPGCTVEACTIRDNFEGFKKRNIKVFGLSPDSVQSHKKFVEKYHLPFTLLSDKEKTVAKLYGADGFFVKRISFLIDPEGNIIKEYPKVSPSTHAKDILLDFDNL